MKIVSLKIDDKLYEELERRAKEEGFLTIAEYVRFLISKELGKQIKEESIDELQKRTQLTLDKVIPLLERKIQDRINPFTSKVDELSRKSAEIIERIEEIEQRVQEIEEKLKVKSDVESRMKAEHKTPRKTAIDILREQKVIFERDIANRIKDRDSFFARLEQSNAKVIEAKDERVAVDPDFWENFVKRISSIATNNDDDIKRILDPVESRLFYKLKESALAIYDSTARKWHILVQ